MYLPFCRVDEINKTNLIYPVYSHAEDNANYIYIVHNIFLQGTQFMRCTIIPHNKDMITHSSELRGLIGSTLIIAFMLLFNIQR